jgi:asparagine synthase (glutamine-hydrolysing)
MRARYALILGRGAERHKLRQSAAGKGLVIAAELPDFLLVTERGASVLVGPRSAVVGRVWTSDHCQLDLIDKAFESAAAADDLSTLPSGYWGNFVLFMSGEDTRPRAYRDPSGAVGAFHLQLAGTDLFFSDAEFARDLGFLASADVDLEFVVHWLQFPFLKTARAGLTGIVEVAPGEWRHRTDRGWSSELGWDPCGYCWPARAVEDAGSAMAALRETAVRVIPRQAGTGRPHLQLSGGLDSSIIGACLHQTGTDFEGIHFATASPDGDERRFAEDAAAACQARLTTIVEDELSPALEMPIARSVLPGANPLLAPIERAIVRYARENGAVLLIDGGGGDNLFCYLATAAPVVDALRHGPRGAACSSIRAVAEVTHSTWWDVAKAAWRLQFHRLAGRAGWKEDRSLIDRRMLLREPQSHPWLSRIARLPQGKREHVETILQIQHFFDRRTDWALPVLHPLLAQPLLEICLRIPSWMWVEGGRDRAVARGAFKDMVPDSILSRRMKGSLQGFIRRSFERLRPDIRELLLGGELRHSGILDNEATAAVLADGWEADSAQLRLTEMASLELWMRSWRS